MIRAYTDPAKSIPASELDQSKGFDVLYANGKVAAHFPDRASAERYIAEHVRAKCLRFYRKEKGE